MYVRLVGSIMILLQKQSSSLVFSKIAVPLPRIINSCSLLKGDIHETSTQWQLVYLNCVFLIKNARAISGLAVDDIPCSNCEQTSFQGFTRILESKGQIKFGQQINNPMCTNE